MPQKINLRDSARLYQLIKAVYVVLAFFHAAILLRLLVLLPLVGRKFLSGGIQQFLELVYAADFTVLMLLSLLKLVPITPAFHVFDNITVAFIVAKVLRDQEDTKRHLSYGLIIVVWSMTKTCNYIYHYYKLKTLNRSVPESWRLLHTYVVLVSFPIEAVLEFVILFLSLRHLQDHWKTAAQVMLLLFIPTKLFLYKRLVLKYFKDEKSD